MASNTKTIVGFLAILAISVLFFGLQKSTKVNDKATEKKVELKSTKVNDKATEKKVELCSICLESVKNAEQNAFSLMKCRHGSIHHKECVQNGQKNGYEKCPVCTEALTGAEALKEAQENAKSAEEALTKAVRSYPSRAYEEHDEFKNAVVAQAELEKAKADLAKLHNLTRRRFRI